MARYRARCCGELLESRTVHDFVECKCGKSFVDGGDEYMRLGSVDGDFPVRVDEEGNDVSSDS
jgi:hypothetical protein